MGSTSDSDSSDSKHYSNWKRNSIVYEAPALQVTPSVIPPVINRPSTSSDGRPSTSSDGRPSTSSEGKLLHVKREAPIEKKRDRSPHRSIQKQYTREQSYDKQKRRKKTPPQKPIQNQSLSKQEVELLIQNAVKPLGIQITELTQKIISLEKQNCDLLRLNAARSLNTQSQSQSQYYYSKPNQFKKNNVYVRPKSVEKEPGEI